MIAGRRKLRGTVGVDRGVGAVGAVNERRELVRIVFNDERRDFVKLGWGLKANIQQVQRLFMLDHKERPK